MSNSRILGTGGGVLAHPNFADGHMRARARLGSEGEMIVSRLNPRYYELATRGRMFIYSSAAAGIVLADVTTTNQFGIWNPLGSGVLFVPFQIRIGVVSGASGIAGTVCIYYQEGVGANIGTAAPITVWTDITPRNALLGGGYRSRLRFATTNTLTAAPARFRTAAWSQMQGRTGSANSPWTMAAAGFPVSQVDSVSTPQLVPGTAMFLAGNKAIALTVHVTVIGAEIPLPLIA